MEQNDSRVLDYIKRKYLEPPSTLPYNLQNPDVDPSMGQSDWVKKIFKNLVILMFLFRMHSYFICNKKQRKNKKIKIMVDKPRSRKRIGENLQQKLRKKTLTNWECNIF